MGFWRGGTPERLRHSHIAVSQRLEQAITLMRCHDPQKQEDGFGLMRAHAGEHLDELMAAFGREEDHGLRCWLLELIGQARSPRAISLLAAQLHEPDEALRSWAAVGLRRLDTAESRGVLYQARAQGLIS